MDIILNCIVDGEVAVIVGFAFGVSKDGFRKTVFFDAFD